MKFLNRKTVFVNLLVIVLFLFLPYYIFNGRLFIGGDDTRLYYIFPLEWIKNISFYSWFSLSSEGFNSPNQFAIPILLLAKVLSQVVRDYVVLDYFIFSSALIFGFLSFQLVLSELVRFKDSRSKEIILLGALFYSFSPILLAGQLSLFLYDVWLVGLIPLSTYLFIKYLRSGNYKYVFFEVMASIVFSISLFSIPWTLGYALSIFVGILFGIFIYSKSEIVVFLKRSVIFFSVLGLAQSFWFLPFLLNFLSADSNNFSSQALSGSFDSFSTTVLATATGNIIFPVLNLFQRQLVFDFNSEIKGVFQNFYDKTIPLNMLFPLILLFGLANFKKVLISSDRKIFVLFSVAFLVSLFLFTVNIGFLKNIFLSFGFIPGFSMFANFWNKFDLAFIFLYSFVLSFSLLIANKLIKNKIVLNFINIFFLLLIILNAVPIKDLVSSPVWTTKDIYSAINLPKEYVDFMNEMKSKVEPTDNILSLPFNIASYSFIKGQTPSEIYVGTSPIKLLTGINDFSGELSFSPQEATSLISYIQSKDYKRINEFLVEHNINYIFLVKNLPEKLLKSYLFNKNVPFQDENFIKEISDKRILVSSKENYELYSTKNKSALLQSKNISYRKISPVKYEVSIKGLDRVQQLIFLDSFSGGWKLFEKKDSSFGDLQYSFRVPVFDNSHKYVYGYANSWDLNPGNNTHLNLVLYFVPQNYFYLGSLVSFLTLLLSAVLFFKRKK